MTPTAPLTLEAAPEIAAIREALDAGPTPGPWSVRGGTHWLNLVADVDSFGKLEHWRCLAAMDEDSDLRKEDAAFIAACNPTAMTAVLATIAHLEARLREAEADVRRYQEIRSAGSQLKIYRYDDPSDCCSGDWRYKPTPDEVDAWCDAAIAAHGKNEE